MRSPETGTNSNLLNIAVLQRHSQFTQFPVRFKLPHL